MNGLIAAWVSNIVTCFNKIHWSIVQYVQAMVNSMCLAMVNSMCLAMVNSMCLAMVNSMCLAMVNSMCLAMVNSMCLAMVNSMVNSMCKLWLFSVEQSCVSWTFDRVG